MFDTLSRAVVAAVLSVPLAARADLVTPAASPPPGWAVACTREVDGFSLDRITSEDPRGPGCRHTIYSMAEISVAHRKTQAPMTINVIADPKNAYDAPAGWASRADQPIGDNLWLNFQRHLDGKTAIVSGLWPAAGPPSAPAIVELERVTDRCLALAPRVAVTADDPEWAARCRAQFPNQSLDACLAALRAARNLEALCRYEGAAVGDAGEPGEAHTELQKILALGRDATPVLVALMKSHSPVARVAAAIGLGQVRSAEGRRALEKLAHDHQRADVLFGCVGDNQEVAPFARQSLAKYR